MNGIVERCDFRVGEYITPTYCIEKMLGEGSFGKVFKVNNQKKKQTYALKLFKFWEMQPKERENMFARFQMEFETGLINSKYLVKSIEHGLVKGNPFMVMEFCKSDLQKFVSEQPNVNLIKISKEILYGLKDLHKCGKVHRDLKPENVLINANGTAVLTDFGLSGDRAKRLTAVNLLGKPIEIAGTAIYMAPEQAKPKNREVTVLPTMDVFAFGVMLYYLITDKFPFGELYSQNDLVLYLQNAREGKWDREILLNCQNGKIFNKVITGCLIPDFKQRLQTVDEVLALMPEIENDDYEISESSVHKNIVNGVLLRVMQGEEHGAVYKLNELLRGKSKIITIGRNDLSINNILPIVENISSYISRKHCTLELNSNNKWYIRDGQWDKNATSGWKNSLNGTFVNSTEVSENGMPIKTGDIITIGDVKLRVEGY